MCNVRSVIGLHRGGEWPSPLASFVVTGTPRPWWTDRLQQWHLGPGVPIDSGALKGGEGSDRIKVTSDEGVGGSLGWTDRV